MYVYLYLIIVIYPIFTVYLSHDYYYLRVLFMQLTDRGHHSSIYVEVRYIYIYIIFYLHYITFILYYYITLYCITFILHYDTHVVLTRNFCRAFQHSATSPVTRIRALLFKRLIGITDLIV